MTAVHEHGLAHDILAGVGRAFAGDGGRIRHLRLRIREGSGIEPDFLVHGLEEEAIGTSFEGATFEVEAAPLRLVCPLCGFEAEATAWAGRCPACGGIEVRPAGAEIEFVEVAVEAPRGAPVVGAAERRSGGA